MTTHKNNKNQITEISKVMGQKWKTISAEEKKVRPSIDRYVKGWTDGEGWGVACVVM